jgi:8-oxo-dGTP pyrophosphatase MutT (NUDIX family)
VVTATASPAIPAATLIILRDGVDESAPELLMLERARAMAFAGGALVFPGGRIDPGDRKLAELVAPHDPDESAARIAAIRETIEEAGLPIGLSPSPSPEQLMVLRAALHAGKPFARALAIAGCTLELDAVEPFARWLPDHRPVRIFDTRFYLARLPASAPVASVDATENVTLFWASAASVLADADAGRATLIFPTRRTLERLALYPDYESAVADARAHPIRTITPWIEERDGGTFLCIPDDLGFPITAERLDAAQRG